MARRSKNDIEVAVVGEADFGRARKDAKKDLDRIEDDAKGVARDVEKAFDNVELSPELDSTEIRQAIDLARDLDRMVVDLDIDTDLDEIKQAERIARSLRAFQGRVDLSVEGREELREVLGLAESMDQIRDVKVQVQGRQDLERAADLAADLEQTRKVRIDVDDSDIDQIDDQLTEAGERGADGIADAIGGIDFDGIGRNALDSMTGALSAAGPWAAVAGGAGVLFADELLGGFSAGWNSKRSQIMRSITSALSPEELAVTGEAAGDAFAAGFGESLPQLKADADELKSILGDMVDDADMDDLIRQATVLSDVLGVDVAEAAEQARRSVNQGLADDWQDAFDDMTGVTQEFGETGREALEVVNEFGTNFARFEVDGGRAVQFVAGAFRDGLIPTIDRAGESFEEFTTRVIDGDAADAIAELGLNFREVQADVAAGGERASDAMADVIERVMAYGDESDRTRLNNVLFGQSFEQVTDQAELLRRMLELLGDETDAYAGKAEEVSEAFESQVGSFTRYKNELTAGAAEIGGFFRDAADDYYGFQDFLTNLYGDAIDSVIGRSDELNEKLAEMDDGGKGAAAGIGAARLAAQDAAFEMDGLADSTGDAADAADELEAAFAALEGRFDASRGLRRVQEQAEVLMDSVGRLEGSLFTAGGQFDQTDPAARRFEATLESMNLDLLENAQRLQDGTIEADQFRIMQRNTEEAIRAAGEAAGLTDAQVEALIATYTAVPDQVNTDLTADDSQGRAELNRFLSAVNSARGTVTIDADGSSARAELNRFLYLAGTSRASVRVSSNRVTQRASGGPTTGLTLVGEEGPELLDLGSARGFVHDAATTSRMMSGGSSSGPARVRFDFGGSEFDQFMKKWLRRSVRTGGGVQVFFGEGR